MRVLVRVTPGASRAAVGGAYRAGHPGTVGRGGTALPPAGPADPLEAPMPALVVAVTERAVDGAATTAALRAVARAFGVRPRQVQLIRGATSRSKVLEVGVDPAAGHARLAQLLRGRTGG